VELEFNPSLGGIPCCDVCYCSVVCPSVCMYVVCNTHAPH